MKIIINIVTSNHSCKNVDPKNKKNVKRIFKKKIKKTLKTLNKKVQMKKFLSKVTVLVCSTTFEGYGYGTS